MAPATYLLYFLIFLVVLGVLLYLYTAYVNTSKVKVNFFGSEKKISLRSLILICFVDGVVLGFIIGYLIFIYQL